MGLLKNLLIFKEEKANDNDCEFFHYFMQQQQQDEAVEQDEAEQDMLQGRA